MKKIFFYYLVLILSTTTATAQINQGGIPSSFGIFEMKDIPTVQIEKPDIEQIELEDAVDAKQGNIYKYGRSVHTNVDVVRDGLKEELPNGNTIYRIMLHADDAQALGINFSNFWIPSNAKLFLYNADKSQVVGAFTSANNNQHNSLAIELVKGSDVVIEYEESKLSSKKAKLLITELAYAYRGVSQLHEDRDFGDSDNCQVNVNCSPEGDDWQDEKKSACRISIKAGNSYGWCSGALINNTANDCTPYVLTADHCAYGQNSYASANDHNQWVFYFNFEADNCNNPSSSPNSNTISGCSQISYSGAVGGVNGNIGGTSDFYLVELNASPPPSYGLYSAGWDRSTSASSSGVSIHHPSGDIKKISTYTSTLSSGAWQGFGTTHWRVTWAGTANGHGVTEGGSSGSPIFNSNGHIIGDLSGGSSFCTNTNASDLYGKFSHSWDLAGSPNNGKLKPWLDPTNSGATFVDGLYCGVSSTASFNANETNLCGTGPHTVTFNNTSVGNINSYSWQFIGGSPSSASGAGPHNVTYSNTGAYTVILQITDNQGNSAQSVQPAYINVTNGEVVNVDFLPDCYGEEISWDINTDDANPTTVYSIAQSYYPGGNTQQTLEPNPVNVNHELCLQVGCYEFVLNDDYGDGLNGSQYNSCDYDGDFTITNSAGTVLAELDEVQIPNADFGNSMTVDFCVDQSSNTTELFSNIDLFPNPTSGLVNLRGVSNSTVKIMDILGKEIQSENILTDAYLLDLSNEENGIYFIQINTKEEQILKKLILSR